MLWVFITMNSDLRPSRIPLRSKKTKRCSTCRHILIKPEQKAQSVRFKIKLVAANYLPAMSIAFPPSQDPSSRQRAAGSRQAATVEDTSGASGLHAGGTYPFQLALTNPLYDPIKVRLKVEPQVPPPSFTAPTSSPEKAKRPPFVVRLPRPESEIPVAAFAEAWEYEDDEDMFGGDDDELGLERDRGGGGGKGKGIGVIERRANVTVVGGEVVIGKDAQGSIKVGVGSCCGLLIDRADGCTSYSLICSFRTHIGRTTRSQMRRSKRRLLVRINCQR